MCHCDGEELAHVTFSEHNWAIVVDHYDIKEHLLSLTLKCNISFFSGL